MPIFLIFAGVAGLLGLLAYGLQNRVAKVIREGGKIQLRLTGYWPFTAKASEKKMEGGIFDRKMPAKYKNDPNSQQYKDHVLHTVEDFFAGKSDFVSLSGDDAAWPYGQKVIFPWVDGRVVVGRVVDTGSHFRGAGKLYRVSGAEPIDVCVASAATVVPKVVIAQIIAGDNYEKGKAVATGKFAGQDVVVGRLARALDRTCAPGALYEKQAVAWAHRNAVHDVLGSMVDALESFEDDVPPGQESVAVVNAVLAQPAEADPTNGATAYWRPVLADRFKAAGDAYRAATIMGDEETAGRLEHFAGCVDSANDIRAHHAEAGVEVACVVGGLEMLK